MLSNSRGKKLEQLIKTAKGKKSCSQLKALVTQICNVDIADTDIRCLNVNDTEEIKMEFFKRIKSSEKILKEEWKKSEYAKILLLLQNIASNVGKMPVVFFSSVDDCTGSVVLPAEYILFNADAMWKEIKGDLCIATQDNSSGLCLEENFYDLQQVYHAEGIYEMTRWGVFHLTPIAT